MERLSQSRLASSLTIILGVWLIISPLVISISGAALTSLLITGATMFIFGLVQIFWENSLPSWINALAAVWLFVTAFIFTVSDAVVWNQVITAIIAFSLAMWDGAEIGEVSRIHHTHAV